MNWIDPDIDVFIPDHAPLESAIRRTTHLAIGAHPDDLEIFAYHGIATCYDTEASWFTGVTMTHGGGSVRAGELAETSEEALVHLRRDEQRLAAQLGRYGLQLQLKLSSEAMKSKTERASIEENLAEIIKLACPKVLYLHSPFDKHPTHLAVFARVMAALRKIGKEYHPEACYGCEVWRDLDWLPDELKVPLPTDRYPHLSQALVGLYDSQIRGGKRYDLAVAGRRMAQATFFQSHGADRAGSLTWAVDLLPLLSEDAPDPLEWTGTIIDRFKLEVVEELRRYL